MRVSVEPVRAFEVFWSGGPEEGDVSAGVPSAWLCSRRHQGRQFSAALLEAPLTCRWRLQLAFHFIWRSTRPCARLFLSSVVFRVFPIVLAMMLVTLRTSVTESSLAPAQWTERHWSKMD